MSDTIINDPIHGTIAISPICVKIIDTPQFQRLRHIKQLGYCSYVYPGAAHTRFEHSIGVGYLARQLATHLQERITDYIERLKANAETTENVPLQTKTKKSCVDKIKEYESIQMTDLDVACIEIAGLCHDLGHGPFSHLFDQIFYKDDTIAADGEVPKDWKHEIASIEMFQHMINENDELQQDFKNMFNVSDEEFKRMIDFIKNLIVGKPCDGKPHYMFEIVANKSSEIDVDKMDYFARDCHGLGIKIDFDHLRYIQNCRVMISDNSNGGRRSAICVRDKATHDLYEMFHTRNTLFRRALFHKVSKGIEYMITEALVAANDVIKLQTKDGCSTSLSKAWSDMAAYEQLTDGIINFIVLAVDPDGKLKKSKALIERIHKRDLYKCIYESPPRKTNSIDVKPLEEDIKQEGRNCNTQVDADDFFIKTFTYSYGKGNENPINGVFFFRKNTDKCFKTVDSHKVSTFVPRDVFQETIVRVYSKHNNNQEGKRRQLQEIVLRCSKSWFKDEKPQLTDINCD